jgi:hypothetical protein
MDVLPWWHEGGRHRASLRYDLNPKAALLYAPDRIPTLEG